MALIDREQFDRINKYIYQRDLKRERAKASAPFAFLSMLLIGWGIAYLFKEAHIYDLSGYFFFGTPFVIGVFWTINNLFTKGNREIF